MRFTVTEHVPSPREEVFRFQRDRVADVLDRMPGVVSVEVLSREVEGPRIRTVKRWTGAVDALPRAVRAAVPESAAQWKDTAVWDESRWAVDWSMDLYGFPGGLVGRGRNRFDADGDETIVQVTGELVLVPGRIPGGAVLRPLLPAVERLILAQIRTNLRHTLDAIAERLAEGV